ncbi:MAG: hypothetical protein K1X50_12670 [Candidatus Promineofilum sp.]|nr:hypothetical protein [Promineifilum sp.]
MVRFLLVLALAAAAALGTEWISSGVPVSAAAAPAVRAERWRLLFGPALLVSGGLVVIFAAMLGVLDRARTYVVALRKPVPPVVEGDHA